MSLTSPSAATAASSSPSFAQLGLCGHLRSAVRARGYDTPTPIQRAAIPLVLDDHDLLGCAQTGTGKTAAFALPILQHLLDDEELALARGPLALVLAPTRELAAQIGESFTRYSSGTDLRTEVIFGGVKRERHVAALRTRPHVVVATPGRLLDLMSTRDICLVDVEYVVLDEADRMLDMGFIHDIRRILKVLPRDRQTLLFSATMPREIEDLAQSFLVRPRRVAVDPVSSTREPIAQYVCQVAQRDKILLLVHLLRNEEEIDRALVFTRTKHAANRVAQRLEAAGIAAAAIHGNKSQSARERALAGFKAGELRVVVATDLAARGIDVKSLSHVVNFDLPNEPETYVHRVGRTGRAGEEGVAIAFCSPDEQDYLRDIQKLIRRELTPRSVQGVAVTDVAPMVAGERETPAPSRSRGGASRNPSRAAKKAGAGARARRRRRRRTPEGADRGASPSQ